MSQFHKALCLLALLCGCFAESSLAQSVNVPERLTAATNLRVGMTMEDVERIFGRPDNKRPSSGANMESWTYGSAFIFFSENRVVAWSNEDELLSRGGAEVFDLPQREDTPTFEESGWTNAWTPEKEVDSGQILDDMIRDP